MKLETAAWKLMVIMMRAFAYACSVIPGLVVVVLLGGHWASFILAAIVSSAYYHFVQPEEK